MTSSPVSSASWDARTWGALMILCGALFLDGLDVSMVGVALPSIRADLDLSTSTLQWIVSGYVLGYGGLLLLGGRAADLLGRRRVFIASVAAFAFASLLGGLVEDGTLLIVTRFLKGMAAAFTVPAGLSIITTTFTEGPARNRALAIYTAFGASGFSLGLVFGGLLTEVGWRWTFLLPVPIALAIAAAAPRLIRKDIRLDTAKQRYDVGGAVTVTAAMLTLVYGIVEAPNHGWGSPRTMITLAIAVALFAIFLSIERRTANPLVRLGILRSAPLARANLSALALVGSYFGFQFIATLYLQSLAGWSALEMALAFLPAGLLVSVGAPRMGPVVDRFGTAPLMVAGFVSLAVGYALFLRLDATPNYPALVLPTIILLGLGFALVYPAANMQATAGIPDHEQGLASGLVNTSFQIGGAIVLAIVTAVISSRAGSSTDAGTLLDAYQPAIAVVTGVGALGLLVALSGVIGLRRQEPAYAGSDA